MRKHSATARVPRSKKEKLRREIKEGKELYEDDELKEKFQEMEEMDEDELERTLETLGIPIEVGDESGSESEHDIVASGQEDLESSLDPEVSFNPSSTGPRPDETKD